MWQSSNPALNNTAFNNYYDRVFDKAANTATMQGVANKAVILVGLATAAGAVGYALANTNTSILFISWIAALVITLGIYFVIHGKPQLSPILAPIYAIVEGVFLGALTAVAEFMLAQRGLQATGGVALQAFIITASILVAMLALYKMRVLRPTRMFTAFISTATLGVMICYLLTWPLSLLFGIDLPLISWNAAYNDHGMMGLIGLGVNLLILGLASMWLIIDFGMIEEKLKAESPKYMEWYCGFALLVTLAWIYYESVKVVVRVAALFSSRD